MPNFLPEFFRITPTEFIESCNQDEIHELINLLTKNGYLENQTEKKTYNQLNNDVTFSKNLTKLSKCRDLLTLEEENFINELAKRFTYIRG